MGMGVVPALPNLASELDATKRLLFAALRKTSETQIEERTLVMPLLEQMRKYLDTLGTCPAILLTGGVWKESHFPPWMADAGGGMQHVLALLERTPMEKRLATNKFFVKIAAEGVAACPRTEAYVTRAEGFLANVLQLHLHLQASPFLLTTEFSNHIATRVNEEVAKLRKGIEDGTVQNRGLPERFTRKDLLEKYPDDIRGPIAIAAMGLVALGMSGVAEESFGLGGAKLLDFVSSYASNLEALGQDDDRVRLKLAKSVRQTWTDVLREWEDICSRREGKKAIHAMSACRRKISSEGLIPPESLCM